MRHPVTILIVDDQASARGVLAELLADQNYHLVFATSGPEALNQTVRIIPDLVLLDVMMPGMDGFEVCERLRADPHLAEIPIIMITSLDDRDSRLRGLEAGIDDFISKPFDALELHTRIKAMTRLNRYRRLLTERVYRQQAQEEVNRRNQELSLLNQMMIAAAATVNIQGILQLACESLAQNFNFPRAAAWLINEERSAYTQVVEYISPAIDQTQAGLVYSDNRTKHTSPWPISEGLVPDKSPLVIDGTETDPRLDQIHQMMRRRGLAGLLIVPLLINQKTVGFVELGVPKRHRFSSQDLTLAQSMAMAISQALETAHLYQDLAQYAAHLEETVAHRTHDLQSERDRIQAILAALGDAVVVTDTAGTIQYLNPATVPLTGFSETEALGQNWRLWQSCRTRQGETGDRLYGEIEAQVGAGQTWRGEVNNIRKDGSLYDAWLTVAPLFEPGQPDRPVSFVSIQSDITPLKEAERLRALHQAQEKQAALDRLRHTFLSTVKHEMHTPVAIIFQLIEMFEGKHLGKLTTDQRDALMALRRQTRILGQMVEGLTRVAAFLSKQETVRPVLALLEPVFQNVIPLAEFKARSKEITIETDILPDLPALRLDVKQMEEALTQLIDNAIKFNQPGGSIKLSTQVSDDWITINISDTGGGIEVEQMNRIWELFEQGSDPVRRAQEGLGLGLVLARYIVEAHRGLIEVESTPGRGSTFSVKLPRYRAAK